MRYYGSFVLQCYVLRMRVMTSTVGGNLTNRPPAIRHIHVKSLMTPSGIEPATFWLVAQCLDQVRHRVPPLYI